MTGPEHYAEAETLLSDASPPDEESRWDMALLASAQVHATLALAAATADWFTLSGTAVRTARKNDWTQVIA